MAKSKQPYGLDPNTPLKLIEIHKTTGYTFEKIITYGEWINFKKNNNYYYKTVQV